MNDIEQALTLLAQASYSDGNLCRSPEWRKDVRDLEVLIYWSEPWQKFSEENIE